jgi:hypothetical protein
VQVHIIEVRELAAKDLTKTSDPIIYIECFDQKQNTTVKPACLSAVFDELFIFNFRNLDKDFFSEGLIAIRVSQGFSHTRVLLSALTLLGYGCKCSSQECVDWIVRV